MKVACWATEGSSLAWAARLKDEGCDVLLYQSNPDFAKVGKGIVPLAASRDEWLKWGMTDAGTIFFFDCTSVARYDHGTLADRLRAGGRHVVGAGTFCDRLENDRVFGSRLAETCGILAPPTHEFSSVSDAISFLRMNPPQQFGDGGWAWKSDRQLSQHGTFVGKPDKMIAYLESMVVPIHGNRIKCILQERIKGVALSTARWWNGVRFTGPFEGTLEEKAFMNGDVGPSTGCAHNVVWFYREPEPKIARMLCFPAIEQQFRAKRAPPGLYDINAIVDRRGAWFLEWTPRLGYDSELTSQRGISSLSTLLMRLARGEDIDDLFNVEQAYMSVRLSVPPYPLGKIDVAKSPAIGVPINGNDGLWDKFFVAVGVNVGDRGLQVADPYGFVGVAVTEDTSIDRGYERIDAFLEDELEIPDLQHRTDCVKNIGKDMEELAKFGYSTSDIFEELEAVA